MTGGLTRVAVWAALVVSALLTFLARNSVVTDLSTVVTLVTAAAALAVWLRNRFPDAAEVPRGSVVGAVLVATLLAPAAAGIGALGDDRRGDGRGDRTALPSPSPTVPATTSAAPSASATTPPASRMRFCTLMRAFPSHHPRLRAALAAGSVARSDVTPFITDLTAAKRVAPTELDDEIALLLESYRTLRDRAGDNALDNLTLVGATIASRPATDAEATVAAYVGANCPG